MSWVGLADHQGAAFDLPGLGARSEPHVSGDALSCRGTLLFEADVAQFTVPRALIGHASGARFDLEVGFGTGDHLDFAMSVGQASWTHRLPLRITNDLQVVRVSYAWDARSRAAVLSVFQPRSRHLSQCLLPEPRPIPWAALRGLIHEAPQMCRAGDMSFVALSQRFEPAGPMPGLDGATPVLTPEGPRPLRDLSPGDMVHTASGGATRVVQRMARALPARGSFAPRRLMAPYMGLTQDLTISGESLVQLEGSDVEYLLGVEAVLGQADQLGDARAPALQSGAPIRLYHQLLLEQTDVIDGGIGLSALDLGMVPRIGLSAATTLWADVAQTAHVLCGPSPLPLARGYEIVTLNATRAA